MPESEAQLRAAAIKIRHDADAMALLPMTGWHMLKPACPHGEAEPGTLTVGQMADAGENAVRAHAGLGRYDAITPDTDYYLYDLITSILHYADKLGIDPADLLEKAAQHHISER